MARRSQVRPQPSRSAPRHKGTLSARGVLCALGAVGAWVVVASGCSFGRQEPPDMPPFQGTEAFLAQQARVRQASAADEAFREKYNLGDPIAMEHRSKVFLQRQEAIAARSRMIEEAKERERVRRQRERAEEGRRRFEQMEVANQHRDDLRRERERAAEGKQRFAQIAEANKHRDDLRRAEEKAAEGKRRFAQTEFLNDVEKREERRKAQERDEQARLNFSQAQRAARS